MFDTYPALRPLFSALAIGINFAAYLPYLLAIRRGETKPHVFSWIIWGTTTTIVFFAQVEGDGGVGAWPAGISGLINYYVAVAAFRTKTEFTVHRLDWLFFGAALSSLPFWYFTSDPLWAVVVLTTVDILGFGPTLRKAYHKPFEESALFFALFMISNALVLLALETRSPTTMLFPAAISFACLLMVGWLLLRRRMAPAHP